jgi:hypothetical protein
MQGAIDRGIHPRQHLRGDAGIAYRRPDIAQRVIAISRHQQLKQADEEKAAEFPAQAMPEGLFRKRIQPPKPLHLLSSRTI